MQHSRADYNRIQDPSGKIPADEPVFLLRGQDKHAPEVVAYWASLVLREGGDPKIANAAMEHARGMRDWQAEHCRKAPDLPHSS